MARRFEIDGCFYWMRKVRLNVKGDMAYICTHCQSVPPCKGRILVTEKGIVIVRIPHSCAGEGTGSEDVLPAILDSVDGYAESLELQESPVISLVRGEFRSSVINEKSLIFLRGKEIKKRFRSKRAKAKKEYNSGFESSSCEEEENKPSFTFFRCSLSGNRDMLFMGYKPNLAILKSAFQLNIDSTYKTVPEPFKAINVVAKCPPTKHFIPCFHVLVMDEKEDTLDQVLLQLGTRTENVKKFITDFSSGFINAIKKTYKGAEIQGCFFHFMQAIHRKMVEYGIASNKDLKAEMKAFPKCEKTEEVERKFESLLRDYPNNGKTKNEFKFLDQYFRKTWLKRYSPEIWRFKEGDVTNNAVESFHSSLKGAMQGQEKNPKTFKRALKNLQKDRLADVIQIIITGDRPLKKKERARKKKKKKRASVPENGGEGPMTGEKKRGQFTCGDCKRREHTHLYEAHTWARCPHNEKAKNAICEKKI